MGNLAAGADPGVLDLAVGPDFRLGAEFGSGPQVRVRPDVRARADDRAAPDGVFDLGAVADGCVQQVRRGSYYAVRPDTGLAPEERAGQDDGVAPDLYVRLDVGRDRVPDRYPVAHVGVQDAPAQDLLGPRQVRPVVYQVRLFQVLQPVRHRPRAAPDHLQHVRQINFAVAVIGADPFYSIPDLRQVEGVQPQVDQAYPPLRLRSLPLLDDPHHAGVFCHPAEPRRVRQLRDQHRRPDLGGAMPLYQLPERPVRDKRPVPVYHEQRALFLFDSVQRDPHRIPGAELLLLQNRLGFRRQNGLYLLRLMPDDDEQLLR